MTAALLAQLWRNAAPWVEDPSLVGAPFVVVGYVLGRRKDPRAWICMAISNTLLVLVGVHSAFNGPHHLGLFISAPLAVLAVWNFATWRRGHPDPVIARLEAELAAARERIADLERQPGPTWWAA